MNHYCTYFDSGFLLQGVAMWRSLRRHDAEAILWILALDEKVATTLDACRDPSLRVVLIEELELWDSELAVVKAQRTHVEYFFTLSPCLPRWLLRTHAEIDRITYLDADLYFFGAPHRMFTALEASGASVLIVPHRFPSWLRHMEDHGLFNVGIQVFRNNASGHSVLDDWRARCLEWCHDRVEDERYADQKYLDAWPTRFGGAVLVYDDPGVNLAPWNWMSCQIRLGKNGAVLVGDRELLVFHFARFRPIAGTSWWQSGQLQYGVMPWTLRQRVYGHYWRGLVDARRWLTDHGFSWSIAPRAIRWTPKSWHLLAVRVLFGSDWLRLGSYFVSGRLGLGRVSGRYLAWIARLRKRRDSATDAKRR